LAPILETDLHVHLYGCLTAQDIWLLGRDVWRERRERLDVFAARFESSFGRRPRFQEYWTKDDGQELLKADWQCLEAVNFEQFEAKFGLPIALFPVSPAKDWLRVLDAVLRRHLAEGRRHVEYRMVYPPPHARVVPGDFFTELCTGMRRASIDSGGAFTATLAVSLSRDCTIALQQYRIIRDWQEHAPKDLLPILTGIDFSGYEEAFPPRELAPVAGLLHEDNLANSKSALALLIHAGETCENDRLDEALARIEAAVDMGAHRIGHALALGTAVEGGSSPLVAARDRILEKLSAADSAVIECCITSNLRLGGVATPQKHPVRRFLDQGLRVCFATDDPGMFGVDGVKEAAVAQSAVGAQSLEKVMKVTPSFRSEVLSGRSEHE
jgi:adenosine deaminase